MTHQTLLTFIESKTDDIASFGGGVVLSLITWLHISPEVIIGKLLMTFVVGLVGGIGGITAKALCNYSTKRFKEWMRKRKLQRLKK